jgi:flagellar basal-body rod protein FlgG
MIDVIANNLANVNTTAFKRSRVSFEDVMYETLQGPTASDAAGQVHIGPVQVGKGVRIAAVLRLHTEGSTESTGRPLDVAIEGDGFLQVRRPDGGIAYTRDGNLTMSDTGTLVTSGGYPLLPEVQIPREATSVTIAPNGAVSVLTSGTTGQTEVGRLEVARFLNPNGLQATGENQYVATDASGEAVTGYPQDEGFGRLVQGSLESSNVEVVQEMTDMIAAQRAYEINARAIQVGESMMQATNDLIR